MVQKRLAKKSRTDEVEEIDDDLDIDEKDESDDERPLKNAVLVSSFLRMYPRAVFHTPTKLEVQTGKKPSIARTIDEL